MITHSNFWPLDFDQEVEIYDNPSWEFAGSKKARLGSNSPTGRQTGENALIDEVTAIGAVASRERPECPRQNQRWRRDPA